MKAITIHQPWASLIACEAKIYETRSWTTSYRGKIAIHAGKKLGYPMELYFTEQSKFWAEAGNVLLPGWETFQQIFNKTKELPYGSIIATAELVDCWKCIGSDKRGDLMIFKEFPPTTQNISGFENSYLSDRELLFGNFSQGRYAWELRNVKLLDKPIPCRGQQKLWKWKSDDNA